MVQVLRLLQVNRPTVSDTTVSLRPVARRADAMNATGLCDVGMVDHTVILELDPYVCFLVVLSGACAIGYRGMIFASSSLSLPGSRFPQTATLRLRVREDLKLKQKKQRHVILDGRSDTKRASYDASRKTLAGTLRL